MAESYDVGVLVQFPDDISERVKLELLELAEQWHGYSDADWPFAVALLPVGDFLVFVFSEPDNANMFISHAERHLQQATDEEDIDQLYTIVMCWSGLAGSDNR